MKNALRLFLVTLFCSFVLAGCGTMGQNFDSSNVKNIKNNNTTKQQVLDWFGLPYKEGTENGLLMWTYQFDKYVAGSTQSKDLVLLFDNNNVVKAYRYTSNVE
jgi:hypothetical protein